MFHHFDSKVAEEYGLIEAILIQNFQFWIEHNRANDQHHHEGRTWTYNSVRAFAELFPYLGRKQIYNALKRLEDTGVILTGKFNESQYNHTTWYAFADEVKWVTQKGNSKIFQKGKSKIIPNGESTDSIKSDTNPDEKQFPAPPRGGAFVVDNAGTITPPDKPAAPAAPKKPAEKKPEQKAATKPPRAHWQPLVDTWYEWYKSHNAGEEPTIKGRNLTYFGQLVDLVHARAVKKQLVWGQEQACKALTYFLELAWSDGWLKGHFLLSNLVDQFDAVYAREALRLQAEKQKQTPPPPTIQSGVEGELQYLRARYKEGDMDPRLITPDVYDKLAARGYLPVGTMGKFPGETMDQQKINAALDWLKTITKTVTK